MLAGSFKTNKMAEQKVIDLREKTELIATDANPYLKEGAAISVHPNHKAGLIAKKWAVEKGQPTKVKGAATPKQAEA